MISDYLDRLGGALSFDRALAHRVRVEIEDHLREGTAADPSPDRRGAEKRAIAACGDPRALAAEFAVIALAKRTRRLGVGVFLGIAGVLIAMKARVAWYALMECVMRDDVRSARFPHRNQTLGRECTVEEASYLASGSYPSF